jgi:hypothetical protein
MKTPFTINLVVTVTAVAFNCLSAVVFSQPVVVNGQTWYDTDGKVIEAHGPGFLKSGDTYYWFGEDKSHNSALFKAVNCYSSKDLVNWKFRNAVVTTNTHPDISNYAGNRIIERPKVLYNEKTGKYVMWAHWDSGNYSAAEAAVFQCDQVDGNYQLVRHFRPFNNMSRDCNLYKAPDGKAYFFSAANQNADMILYKLTDDFLDVKEQVLTLWPGFWREAPVIFNQEKTFYFLNSGATGWAPNQGKYSVSKSVESGWSNLFDFGDQTTFDSQPSYVMAVEGTEDTTYIYCGDRWQDPDLKSSKYIWLPIDIQSNKLQLKYLGRWSIDPVKGTWKVMNDSLLSQKTWKLIMTDSEETEGSDGKAINAFDGNPSTIWHTQWKNLKPPCPHEIQIDLGATARLNGFIYLPRQDNNTNGNIAGFRFFATTDKANWGNPVSTGIFSPGSSEKRIVFPEAVNCRYIRLEALSEAGGKEFTSVAELNVIGNYKFPTASNGNLPGGDGMISICPNPSNGIEICLRAHANSIRVKLVSVVDINGRTIVKKMMGQDQNKIRFNPKLAPGVYILKIEQGDGQTVTKKMVVESSD